jgi:hypothetical protein
MQQEHRQDRSLLGPAQCQHLPVTPYLNGSEDPELHDGEVSTPATGFPAICNELG